MSLLVCVNYSSLRGLRFLESLLVEPYLMGERLRRRSRQRSPAPHRLLALGVARAELRRYGKPEEHRRAHGLEAAGILAAQLAKSVAAESLTAVMLTAIRVEQL